MDASTSTAANPNNSDYDVFISHRGPEVKKTFASHLYRGLIKFGLKVFLDQPELERGDFIISQIESAIRSASVQVAIFSPEYADSKWCLNELVSMSETLETGATVIPVFYKVEPSELRRTRGNAGIYAKAFQRLEKKTTYEPQGEGEGEKSRHDSITIEKWRNALSLVADISGFELKACNDDEGELLAKVVDCVLKNVKGTNLNVADHPTGLQDKVEKFEKILEAKPHVVGIVGSGGVGKTTLVKELFNQKRSQYSRSCFLADIRENASTRSLIEMQNKLLKALTGSNRVIDNIDVGKTALEKHLSSNQALIILDDVDKEDQVNALLPVKTDLHSYSLILITSRDRDVLRRSRVEDSLIYTLTGLDEKYSRELFCWHSCRKSVPPEGFQPLVDKYLEACDGLPLSLKVFGALVYGKEKGYWTEQLVRLQQTLPSEIKTRLRITYDALHGEDKEIFLDIACFFARYSGDTAIKIWEGSGWKGRLGLQNLQNRCLITVDNENYIQMHDQIRDMGREVAETLSPHRIWRWTEQVIENLLPQQKLVVRGIKMDSSECNQDDDIYGTLGTILKLKLLDTEECILESIMKSVKLTDLIWLRWRNCPRASLHSCLPMKKLRVLQVYGKILTTLWEETQSPEELRELEIYGPVKSIPNSICRLKHLERIVVGKFSNIGRVNLIELPEEFCELKSLKALVLKECSRLKSLPLSFGKLTTLEHIDLSFCRNLETLPDSFGSLKNLQHIDLSICYDLKSLPDTFGSLENLQRIDLQGCHKLKRLPVSFGNLKKLKRINLSDCHGLRGLPESFGDLSKLKYIDFSRCHNLKSLPDSFGNLTNLQSINLSNCYDLKTLPDSFDNLRNLQHIDLSKCHNLKSLPNSLQNLNESKIVSLEGCSYLTM